MEKFTRLLTPEQTRVALNEIMDTLDTICETLDEVRLQLLEVRDSDPDPIDPLDLSSQEE